jgi:FtsP/CotA-like multicopper oxidase with cupredoxin domain
MAKPPPTRARSIGRRRFIAGSAATVGAAALLELEACNKGSLPSGTGPGATAHTLTVGYATTRFPGGYTLRTRTYNERTVGPTLTTSPGALLRVRIDNTLPPNPPVVILREP